MRSTRKAVFASLFAVLLLLTSLLPAVSAADANDCPYAPCIVIPGVFQSDVRYYDANGLEMLNSQGKPYSGPFFLEDTKDIVKLALNNAIAPLAKLLITQHDRDQRAAKAIASVIGEAVAGRVGADSTGTLINNIRAVEYDTSVANLSEYDRNYVLNAIPLYDYVNKVGADHLYFFSYVSFDNIHALAERLYRLIQTAKEETGHDKVNLIPISQGGSIYTALMQLYADKGENMADDVHRVCFIVPAADGAAVLGDIYHYGLLDDADALYGYMIPSLLDEDQEWIGYLADIILRYMPNADVNAILDQAVFQLVNGYLKYSTCMWALIPSKDYPACREMYLSGPQDAYIREQTDWYYNAQCGARESILALQAKGIEFFDVVDYNFTLYKICDSWDKTNADGIIHTDSESFGATAGYVDTPLPADYTQANTYCTDPSHNHMDEARIVDASTGILCETTFYFKDQDHERTAANDVIIRLATRIISDDSFTDVHSDPAFPQFNYARNSKKLQGLYNAWVNYDASGLSAEQQAALAGALADAKAALESTVMPTAEFDAAYDALQAVADGIRNEAKENGANAKFIAFITKLLRRFSEMLLKFFGGKGFSDILFFRDVD